MKKKSGDTIPKTRKTNEALNQAKREKKNEFYTTYETIENELVYYTEDLKDKRILCNCNDNEHSNFYKYFTDNFDKLKLKSVTCIAYDEINPAYALEVTGDGLKKTWLDGDGDFRSDECIEYLKKSDIVVTNPPFEYFSDFMLQLYEYHKQFIVLGNLNTLFASSTFPFVKEGRIYLGKSIRAGDTKFYVPDEYPLEAAGCGYDDKGRRYIRVSSVRWLQNIKYLEPSKPLELTCKYDPARYPKYDTLDAINVNKTKEIPCDYFDLMGVPITYFDKHNPDLFEIKGLLSDAVKANPYNLARAIVNGKAKFKRIAIQRKSKNG